MRETVERKTGGTSKIERGDSASGRLAGPRVVTRPSWGVGRARSRWAVGGVLLPSSSPRPLSCSAPVEPTWWNRSPRERGPSVSWLPAAGYHRAKAGAPLAGAVSLSRDTASLAFLRRIGRRSTRPVLKHGPRSLSCALVTGQSKPTGEVKAKVARTRRPRADGREASRLGTCAPHRGRRVP